MRWEVPASADALLASSPDYERAQDWVEKIALALEAKDPDAAADLFSDDAHAFSWMTSIGKHDQCIKNLISTPTHFIWQWETTYVIGVHTPVTVDYSAVLTRDLRNPEENKVSAVQMYGDLSKLMPLIADKPLAWRPNVVTLN
ncbi:hypothetical protein CC1G_11574 [Coprinopsis cinerea okayama7|uniref:SnoaL-like domain-containing protein n=1 Tax=Coprinopsis cinerea (strain Okayama-7 / 130 / ATCC MYA-4618 / FGSC 9003) TaxID=240176 RepID=A8N9S1_COPC7|nr:hypothetical protein CC1G_11574 [Coprinopsis cinerea okayama7\|eukprot:XP_001831577.1 hypothetical protein CC1G_11574 [Coprinopsis cinerea okayama7\